MVLHLFVSKLNRYNPEGISDLPRLNTFAIWNNSLIGSLHQLLGINCRLEWLDASINKLTGEIPTDSCKDNKLTILNIFPTSSLEKHHIV